MENWKTIKYCNNYMISDLGRVKNVKPNRERILSLSHTKDGYAKCSLYYDGKGHTFRVNRLVAEHFIPNPDNKPTVNHIDGNKNNNCATNLEWATLSEQMYHAYKTGLKKSIQGTYHICSKLSLDDVMFIRTHYKARDKETGMKALASRFEVSESCIKRVVNQKSYLNIN